MPTGVGSFLHLKGVPDKPLAKILDLVVRGKLTTEKMIQLAKKVKGEVSVQTGGLEVHSGEGGCK